MENLQIIEHSKVEKKKQIEEDEHQQDITEEDYNRLYKYYLQKQKEIEESNKNSNQINPPNENTPQDEPKIRNQSYQDPCIYNAAQRIAELNRHNKDKKVNIPQQTKNPVYEKTEKINHFDNKNLKDYNIKKTTNNQFDNNTNIIKEYNSLNSANPKVQYKQMLDEQIKENKEYEKNFPNNNKKKIKKIDENVVIAPSNLSNNPIINPVNSYDYNKYLQNKK